MMASALYAQQAPADAEGLQDIVVTAQKRSQSMNNVPMTITAASGDQLARAGVMDTRDLAKISAGFTFAETSLGVPVYTLRGVGFYDQSLASTPAVSVYSDEVPLTFPMMTRGAVLDLERVEMLKGPQGTLFGQNSTGGAINYIAAKPTEDLRYGFDAGYGRFGEAHAGGFISGAVSERITARVAGQTTQRSRGWQKSLTRNETLGRVDKTVARVIVDFKLNEDLTVRLNVNGWRDRSETQAAQFTAILPQIPAALPQKVIDAPKAEKNNRSADWVNTPYGTPQRRQDFVQASARIDYRLNDGLNLTYLAAYSHLREDSNYDADGLAFNAYDYVNDSSLRTFYQEIRLTGQWPRLNWVVGANYEHDKVHQSTPFTVDGSTNVPAPGFLIDAAETRSDVKSRTIAAFGNVEYGVLDTVKVQAGIRYSGNRQKGAGCGASGAANNVGKFFNLLSNLLSGGLSSPNIQPGQCYTLGAPPTFLPGPVEARLSEDSISWKVGVNWKMTDDVLVYANLGRGYKSGGIPALPATSYLSQLPYTQESVLAYEAGVKATLLDRRVQLNGALFYYDYQDKQVLGSYVDIAFGVQPRIVNIPKSRIWGLEGQILARPVTGLQLSVSATYLNSRIQEYQGYDSLAASFGDQSGVSLPRTPKYALASDAEYEFPVSEKLNGFVGGGLTYNSATNAGIGNPFLLRIDSYALLDLRAGVRTADGRWALSAYGRNITNKYYWTSALQLEDGVVRYAGMPTTYGVTLNYRF